MRFQIQARALAIEQQEDPQPQGLQRTATALTTDYIADLDLNGVAAAQLAFDS